MTVYEGVGRILELQRGWQSATEPGRAGNHYLPDLSGEGRRRGRVTHKGPLRGACSPTSSDKGGGSQEQKYPALTYSCPSGPCWSLPLVKPNETS